MNIKILIFIIWWIIGIVGTIFVIIEEQGYYELRDIFGTLFSGLVGPVMWLLYFATKTEDKPPIILFKKRNKEDESESR